MTAHERQQLSDDVESLLDTIDERDKQIAALIEDFKMFKESYARRLDKVIRSINQLEHFIKSHRNLSEIFLVFNEAERAIFNSKDQILSRELVGKWFHKIRAQLFDILNPAASKTSGQFTAANAGTGATAPAEAE